MSPPRTTRRSLLRTGGTIAAVLGTGGLAGCVEGLGNSGSAGNDPLEHVPPVADAVFTVDVNTFFADDGVRNTYNAWLAARAETDFYDGPETLEGTLDDFEDTEGADLRDLSRITAYFSFADNGSLTGNDGTAYHFEGGWDESTMLSLFETEYTPYTESSYAEYTIYEGENDYDATIGVLEEGSYVAGGTEAVRGAIDVHRGETDPIDGPVADAYEDTQAGPVRFATDVREDWFPEEMDEADVTLDFSAVRSMETAAGAIYRDGTTRGLTVSLNVPDASTAEELETTVDGVLTLATTQGEAPIMPGWLRTLLQDASVEQEGESVVLSVERTVDELETIATNLGEDSISTASGSDSDSGSARAAPQVSFEWEYDADARTVTVTHQAGDHVDAERLWIRGEGFAPVDGADATEPTTWADATDDEEVTAGTRLVVGAASDCTLRLIWQTPDTASTLGSYAGPDA